MGLLFGALALVMLAALTFIIGTSLFVGEAVFGSLGWGALHATLFFVAIAVTLVVVALGRTAGDIAVALVVAVLAGVAVGVIFGLSATNWIWLQIADAVNLPVAEEWQVLATVVLFSALVGAVLGALGWAMQEHRTGFLAWFLGGALAVTLVGLFIAIPFGPQVGAAIGVTVGLILWSAWLVMDLGRRGVDTEALQRKLLPMETIEQAQETMTWLQERTGRATKTTETPPSGGSPTTPPPAGQP